MGNQPITTKPLLTQHNKENSRHASMPHVGLKSVMPLFEWFKTVYVLLNTSQPLRSAPVIQINSKVMQFDVTHLVIFDKMMECDCACNSWHHLSPLGFTV
jgi:hypothetical protein